MADVKTIEMGRRELAHRSADGVEVTLLWNPVSDTISVQVVEGETESCFELPVARDQALNAYNHPYAYAALATAA
jgi:hypothetical protein